MMTMTMFDDDNDFAGDGDDGDGANGDHYGDNCSGGRGRCST